MSVRVCQTSRLSRGEIAAPNLEAADVERAAAQTERFLGVHLQRHGRKTVRFEALLRAAGQIAERFDVLEYAERHPILAERGPEAPHVAKQVLALPGGAEVPERAGGGGRCSASPCRG